ncbi:lymphocyte-specific protein 1 [Artibeus jamaicensis]|uniref:lymphocyte-specific protein 1 n=1 Tax=Artibeus jamaicensis TaxID=9417 RepID=UPI00235ACD2C|nr:lymphocyte-specific protein 1 [Artibeus jamaicensis]
MEVSAPALPPLRGPRPDQRGEDEAPAAGPAGGGGEPGLQTTVSKGRGCRRPTQGPGLRVGWPPALAGPGVWWAALPRDRVVCRPERVLAWEPEGAGSRGHGDRVAQPLGQGVRAGAQSADAPARPQLQPGDRSWAERLATQWGLEDEEEKSQERRWRERDSLQDQDQDQDHGGQSPESPGSPEQEKLLKSPDHPGLDEDEGFSDWAQKPEQQPLALGAGVEEELDGDRPCGDQGGDELSPTGARLEGLRLRPGSGPLEGPGPEGTGPVGPEETGQNSLGPAEAWGAEEQPQEYQQPRTPSPLVLEQTTEPGSPPLSPSTKLTDRTESLNRCVQKSNSVKRSQPVLPISKIEERLEQYTQAVETAGRTPKLARQPSIELPSMTVASTKSRWEMGEVQAQSAPKSPSCKDIVAGDMSKKNLWEQKGDSKMPTAAKSTPSGKRYKFVATGHGKYEKVLMDEGAEP